MKKTVLWDDCKKVICTQALKNLGIPADELVPSNFVELISSYPHVSKKAMMSFLKANIEKSYFADSSKEIFEKENNCLFIYDKTKCNSALEVILRYLRNENNSAEAVWCYLDIDKKAVVHFVNRNGWYAEAYFLSDTESSAVHLVQDGNYCLFIPVVFTPNLSEVVQNVSLRGDYYLLDYLPTEAGDLLSKKSGKKSVQSADTTAKKGPDMGDNL